MGESKREKESSCSRCANRIISRARALLAPDRPWPSFAHALFLSFSLLHLPSYLVRACLGSCLSTSSALPPVRFFAREIRRAGERAYRHRRGKEVKPFGSRKSRRRRRADDDIYDEREHFPCLRVARCIAYT